VLLAEHEAVWRTRWAGAAVDLEGDAYHELAVRFALFHLLSLSTRESQLGVGARGLTGPAYGGHVFWDADVYVLPALAAVDPPSAEAMLRYRIGRLPAARDRAREEGRPGARFPWESAGTGREATPTEAVGIDGSRIPILTGEREIHITSDVAWGAVHLARWTGDEAVREAGRELIVETARYLAHRIEVDGDGSAHLRQVMGPDEYHEDVDDNAFTNVMARWHLRCAAEVCGDGEVAGRWRRLADRLVDGLDPSDCRYRQFDGFDALDPVLLTAVATPPVAADVLLGREAVARAQIIKQADVVMLHHLIPDEMHPGSLQADLNYYLPRTAHGSSLSPAIHAAVLARAGFLDEANHWLDVALRLDLHDLTGTAAGGVHVATMGGCWQAVAMGYLGLRVDRSGALCFDPAFPRSIAGLTVRCRVRGRAVTARADHQSAVIESDGPLRFSPAGSGPGRAVEADRLELHGGTGRWEVTAT
jgi:trehalose/maltose hydrolase-like predicted phosphorylase